MIVANEINRCLEFVVTVANITSKHLVITLIHLMVGNSNDERD